MIDVIIADDRPKWVVDEDRMMTCWTLCSLYKYCSSRHGFDCKRFGGTEIAKLR
jgi:hypothetical protein